MYGRDYLEENNQIEDVFFGLDDYYDELEGEHDSMVIDKTIASDEQVYNNDNPISDQELVERLITLYTFKVQVLDRGYYTGKDGLGQYSLSSVQRRFDTVFSNEKTPVTVLMAEEFLNKTSSKSLVVGKLWQEDVETLLNFFSDGVKKVETIKNDGLAYILRVETYETLINLSTQIEQLHQPYSSIKQRAITLDLTADDIVTVQSLLTHCDDFRKLYLESKDSVVNEVMKNSFDIISQNCLVYKDFLNSAPSYLARAEKKRGKQGDNPTLSKEGGSYIKTSDKKEKKDIQIQNKHKSWGTYDNKKQTFSIFNKGNKDSSDIEMNDVTQGMLGDCYLISSIASVARKMPEHIRNLISYTEGDNTAKVTLYMMNQETQTRTPKQIEVDFNFPVTDFEPSYAKKGDNELWVMLIEKAYAKEMGGYDNIISGSPGEALSVLTGNEAIYSDSESETIKSELNNSTAKNMSAVIGTKSAEQINSMNKPGFKAVLKENSTSYIVRLPTGNEIICEHAYSLLDYSEEKDEITIRNPHGGNNDTFSLTLEEFKVCFSGVYYSKPK